LVGHPLTLHSLNDWGITDAEAGGFSDASVQAAMRHRRKSKGWPLLTRSRVPVRVALPFLDVEVFSKRGILLCWHSLETSLDQSHAREKESYSVEKFTVESRSASAGSLEEADGVDETAGMYSIAHDLRRTMKQGKEKVMRVSICDYLHKPVGGRWLKSRGILTKTIWRAQLNERQRRKTTDGKTKIFLRIAQICHELDSLHTVLMQEQEEKGRRAD
jgi:predicted HD phosphohydrolase